MPVLSLACHLPHNAPHIPWRYNYEQTTKQTKVINNSYIYINISCKCDTNRAGHLTLDAYASRPVACIFFFQPNRLPSRRSTRTKPAAPLPPEAQNAVDNATADTEEQTEEETETEPRTPDIPEVTLRHRDFCPRRINAEDEQVQYESYR